MKNEGKRFEEDFKKSIPDYVLVHRLPDPPQSFDKAECKNSNIRFSRKNPFDYILWDSQRKRLFALELKTVQDNSISFERTKEEHGKIHYHQIIGLNEWNKYDGVVGGLVVEFRKSQTTIFIDIDTFNKLSELITKKSFNIDDLNKNALPYLVIPQEKKRTRYLYDIEYFLNGILEEEHEEGRNRTEN